jgi:hypothetical protein
VNGPMWLTIPVMKKGVIKNHSPIHRIQMDRSHRLVAKTLVDHKSNPIVRAPFF